MLTARSGWSRVILVAIGVGLATPALAADHAAERGKDAKRAYEEATAAFGLGRYAVAAEKYEAAFSLRPDPALLYNAAQSYRLAGNKQRAMELYRNCLRLYPDFPNAEDARNHVASLRKQIDDEQRAATAPAPIAPLAPRPPVAQPAPMPAPVAAAPPVASPTAAPTTMPPPVLAQPAPPPSPALVGDATVPSLSAQGSSADQDRPITQKTWFWVALGAAAVAVGAVAIVLSTRGTSYPDPTFGTAHGN